jgi:hypothetical protein
MAGEPALGPKVFLLSPASLAGPRAGQLLSRAASFPLARLYRSPAGVPIGQAYAFVSALYFRGKLAYALRFGAAAAAVLVIAPGYGLVAPDWPLTPERLRRLRRTPVDPRRRSYVGPLRRDALALAAGAPPSAAVVLLGSLATGKYLDVLEPVFGERLVAPTCFAGLGDMSRGSLLLRAAASGEELAYAPAGGLRREPRSAATSG